MKLAYLMFADNSAYCKVTDISPKTVTVDQEEKTWRCDVWSPQARPIGSSCYISHSRAGIIGVYDIDNISHVNSMVHAAIEAQRDYRKSD